jgi:acetyl esterase/lipase
VRFKLVLAAVAVLAAPAAAQRPNFELKRIERPAEPDAIPLWPAGSLPAGSTPEQWGRMIGNFPDGSRTESRVARNVSQPTLTPVLPDPRKATGAAVVIAPGGAFLSLSMDGEGYAVARRLADRGIAAFVLKYRLNATPVDEAEHMAKVAATFAAAAQGRPREIVEPRATLDALQALKLIRATAARWGVDPKRVGMIGFSAGAMTAMQAVLTGTPEQRPAFFGYIYGPMLPVAVPANAPPMFAALAIDDGLFGKQGFGLVDAWRTAGASVELHAYEHGDHGFGTGKPGTTSIGVIDQFTLWLASRGLLTKG